MAALLHKRPQNFNSDLFLFLFPFFFNLISQWIKLMWLCSLFDHLPVFDYNPSQWLIELRWPLQNKLESGEEISTWTKDRDQGQAGFICWWLHTAITWLTSFCVCHSTSYHACGPRAAPVGWFGLVMASQRGEGDGKEQEEPSHCRVKDEIAAGHDQAAKF